MHNLSQGTGMCLEVHLNFNTRTGLSVMTKNALNNTRLTRYIGRALDPVSMQNSAVLVYSRPVLQL